MAQNRKKKWHLIATWPPFLCPALERGPDEQLSSPFLEIGVENFRAISIARSLSRFFQRAFPLLRLRVLSSFQCRIGYTKFAMFQTSEPHAVESTRLNFLRLRFANRAHRHRDHL